MAARIKNIDRRVKRLETLEDSGDRGGDGAGDWILIETIELEVDFFEIEFENIPQDFQHLWIIYSAGTTSSAVQHIEMVFNLDEGANYHHVGNAFDSGAGRTTDIAGDVLRVGRASNQRFVRPNNYAAGHITIPDYKTEDKYRSMVFANFYDSLGAFEVADAWAFTSGGGIWEDQSPITNIKFTLTNANDFREGTVFSLYKVR